MLEQQDPERIEDPERFLAAVEERLATAFEGPPNGTEHTAGASVLEEAARHLCLADGAKRTRPRLVQLFARAVEAPADVAVDIAVSAELIHAASLLHDDVIDEGSQRRGQPTANRVWGNLAAVLAGDLILSRAIQRLLRWPRPVSEGALAVVVEMSCAAITEAERRYQAPVAARTWRRDRRREDRRPPRLVWPGRRSRRRRRRRRPPVRRMRPAPRHRLPARRRHLGLRGAQGKGPAPGSEERESVVRARAGLRARARARAGPGCLLGAGRARGRVPDARPADSSGEARSKPHAAP